MKAESNLLLRMFLSLLDSWSNCFAQTRTYQRITSLAIALMASPSDKTLANTMRLQGRQDRDHSAEEHLFSRSPWEASQLFHVIFGWAARLLSPKRKYLPIAFDDTHLCKRGKKIKGTGWARDPLGPPFQNNLIWCQRFVQASFLIPGYDQSRIAEDLTACPAPARAIPVGFQLFAKPSKLAANATQEQRLDHEKRCYQNKPTTIFRGMVGQLRQLADKLGFDTYTLIAIGDGSYCNRNTFNLEEKRVVLLCRCRKDIKLCFSAPAGGRAKYAKEKFTPNQVLHDSQIPKHQARIFYAGRFRNVSYKEVSNVLWQSCCKTRPLRLIVVSGLPARKRTKRSAPWHRPPAYLLTTDLKLPADDLIPMYFDRWEIEVNHRDEKSFIGIQTAQFQCMKAVSRWPPFMVALYAMLQLSAIRAYGFSRDPTIYGPLAKWQRKPPQRPTIRDLLSRFRLEAFYHQNPLLNQRGVIIDPVHAYLCA